MDAPDQSVAQGRATPEDGSAGPAHERVYKVLRRRIPALVTGRDGPIARTLGPGLRPRRLETKP